MKRTVRTLNAKAVTLTLGALLGATLLLTSCNGTEGDRAERIALDHAGVNADAVASVRRDVEYEDGRKVYEVNFNKDGYEYEYHIDAETNEVLKAEKEKEDRIKPEATPEVTPEAKPETIGADKAKESALAHAGVLPEDAEFERTELDRDDGRTVYEVEFYSKGYEYDYEIDAYTAEVVKSEKEYDPLPADRVDPKPEAKPEATPEVTPEAKPETIGADKAKESALAHAGVLPEDAEFERTELDRDDGRTVYEVEFYSKGYEYDYEIDAYTAEIVKSEKEYDPLTKDRVDPKPEATPEATPEVTPEAKPELIGKDKAKEIALAHVALDADKVRFEEVELDNDDGKKVYELDFVSGNYEYEYEIDAYTGKILKWDKERDD